MEKNSSQPLWLRRLRIVSSLLTFLVVIVVSVQSFITNYALQSGVVDASTIEVILKALFVAGWAAFICWVLATYVSSLFLTAFTRFLVIQGKNSRRDDDSAGGQ